MSELSNDQILQNVRSNYENKLVNKDGGCSSASSCCGGSTGDNLVTLDDLSVAMGYSEEELGTLPEGANLGLGCGNPQAIANLKPGETVLDLGSGAGIDCFLAAKAVGEKGLVIGVDMTPKMISTARESIAKTGLDNIQFRLGEIEHLPVADNSIDVIISNCVINLSPDKQQVFNEAYRVLADGGRLAVSDVVAYVEMPDDIRKDLALYTGCISGASMIHEVEEMLEKAGFTEISVEPKYESKDFIKNWAPGKPVTDFVVSSYIQAVKKL
jgi:arsenite methyltransferase